MSKRLEEAHSRNMVLVRREIDDSEKWFSFDEGAMGTLEAWAQGGDCFLVDVRANGNHSSPLTIASDDRL